MNKDTSKKVHFPAQIFYTGGMNPRDKFLITYFFELERLRAAGQLSPSREARYWHLLPLVAHLIIFYQHEPLALDHSS